MKIEAGKYYLTRDKSRVAGPMREEQGPSPNFTRFDPKSSIYYSECGRYLGPGHDHLLDLVEEAPRQPPSTDPKGQAGSEKPQLHLIPTIAMQELAASLADGATRYGAYNWRNTRVSASTYISAMMRHTDAYRDGEELTTDSLVTHLGAIMANCSILLDAAKHGTLDDDRPK